MAVDATLEDLLAELDAGHLIPGGSPLHLAMHRQSQEAIRITTELNGTYHDEAGVRALLSELTGQEVDDTVGLFPPFTSDFGRNIRFGRNVFVNSGCRFQDQGGLTIGDGALIGHNTVIATLNHAMDPARRADLEPAPVVIGEDVWIGSNSTITPGVTIGDGVVIGAGSVVTKDIPAGMVAVGSPARVIREVSPDRRGE
ncbi:MAG TPA: sugar O-acetyltransferase [Candidatus Corynebacterium avicola]|uniref:Sugar O-acetyltransferase n=1 Tax=Candidatus Corynebacterium avicola TaxID=2838527 RepID=A0A9D1RQS5_9CORY|nr:sugar O-acetyltransferase [Candidatus Corynebacterium avicola]